MLLAFLGKIYARSSAAIKLAQIHWLQHCIKVCFTFMTAKNIYISSGAKNSEERVDADIPYRSSNRYQFALILALKVNSPTARLPLRRTGYSHRILWQICGKSKFIFIKARIWFSRYWEETNPLFWSWHFKFELFYPDCKTLFFGL